MVKNGQRLCEVTSATEALLLSRLATNTALLRQTEEQELVTKVLRRQLHEHRKQGLTPKRGQALFSVFSDSVKPSISTAKFTRRPLIPLCFCGRAGIRQKESGDKSPHSIVMSFSWFIPVGVVAESSVRARYNLSRSWARGLWKCDSCRNSLYQRHPPQDHAVNLRLPTH